MRQTRQLQRRSGTNIRGRQLVHLPVGETEVEVNALLRLPALRGTRTDTDRARPAKAGRRVGRLGAGYGDEIAVDGGEMLDWVATASALRGVGRGVHRQPRGLEAATKL